MASQTTEMQNYGLSSSDHSYIYSDSDDSEEDPTFDLLKQNCSSFSRLSVKKSSKSRIVKEKNEDTEGEEHVQEMVVPELDEKDQKNYDIIQKVIEGGQVQKLKVDQCKIYLRKHGLRLTGTKDILIKRIEEHLNILNGGGEMKYPPSSFVVNCKGDACTGDVVLFEQNVYEMFSIAGRCANGPPCGTRMVVGRIVKESYGAAKQQHTFTIEVLWSKGEKPLPPLHPLLIKGRNLYRLKTMRRKWEDEGERQKMLTEKHARGGVARSERETRVQNKEMRKKMPKSNRNSETTSVCRNEEETRNQKLNPISITSKKPQQQAEKMQHTDQAQCFIDRPTASLKAANMPLDRPHFERQPLTSMNSNKEFEAVKSSFQGHNKNSVQKNYYPGNTCFSPSWRWSARQPQVHDRVLRHENKNSQICRYYAQGRCYYGQNCRYLHQS